MWSERRLALFAAECDACDATTSTNAGQYIYEEQNLLVLLKNFVTSESDLRAIWKRLANHFVLGFCLYFLLYLNAKYARI